MTLTARERLNNSNCATSDEVKFVTLVAKREQLILRLDGSRFHTRFQIDHCVCLTIPKDTNFIQVEKIFFCPHRTSSFENSILDPFQSFVEFPEHKILMAGLHQADLSKIIFHLAPGREAWQMAENQKPSPFMEGVLNLFENMRGRHIHRLHTT